ncbi:serine carboxypeptidase [Trifolium repens]|nr:serine carboxypeptidase [Trifolium repens]
MTCYWKSTYEFGNVCDFNDFTDDSGSHSVSKSCNKALHETNKIVSGYIDGYDVILDVCYPAIAEQQIILKKMATKISLSVDVCMGYEREFYLNLPEVQKALHANRTNLPYAWSTCSNILNYNETKLKINILPILKRIVLNHIPILVYSGDQDSVIPLLVWFHKGQVGGWVTEYGNLLTFATVRGAGHMVPYAQPSRALHLFSSFVLNKRLPNTTRPSIEN